MQKTCPQCGSTFSKPYNESVRAWTERHIYCSKPCYTASQKGKPMISVEGRRVGSPKGKRPERTGKLHPTFSRVELTCKECGTHFEAYNYQKDSAKYCSRSCSYQSKDRGERISKSKAGINNCTRVKGEFHHSVETKAKMSAAKMGRVSWNKGEKSPIECRECKQSFLVYPYEVREGRRYCSRPCMNKHRDQGKTDAAKKIRMSRPYRAWRIAVFERDHYTCVHCYKRGGILNADHIKPFAKFPELRLDISNGRTLCEPCHKKTDTYGNGTRAIRVKQEA